MEGGAPTSGGGTSAPSTSAAAPSAPAAAPSASSATPAASSGASPTGALAGAASAPAANGAPAAEKRIPVVVDGVKREMTRRELADYLANEAPEDDVVSTYRLRAAAQARMKAAAEERKRIEREIARIKDPEQMMSALIEHHGGNQAAIDAAIEAHYRKRLAEQEMTPEQRQAAELRAENERLRKEHEDIKAREKQARTQQMTRKFQAEYHRSFTEAIAEAKLPNTKHTFERMKALALEALNSGAPIDAKIIARDVRAELRAEWEAMHGSLDDDGMLELVGEERMKRIRARDVERLKAQQAAVVPAVTATPRQTDGRFASKEAAQKPVSMRDFFERRRNG